MENETKPEAESVPARFHFHLALINVFFPAMWVVTAALAAFSRPPAPPGPLQRKWKKYLIALLAADLLVFACYAWMFAHSDRVDRPPREPEKPRIGVAWSSDPANVEARVDRVLPASPAERAGFRTGDLIEKIDGTSIANRTEAAQAIQSGTSGAARTVTVRRDGASLDLVVTPEVPRREERGLFDPGPAEDRGDWRGALAFLPSMAVVAIAALVSFRKRRAPVVTWRGFVVASLGSFAAALGVALLLRAIQGGTSRGAMLIALFAQFAALLGLTRLVTVWCGREVPPPPDPMPPLPPVKATLLGVLYLLTGMARVSIVVWTLDQILLQGRTGAQPQALEALATSSLGPLGTLLFVSVVVLLGPFAEESLFRGFLVPRLAAMWGTVPSILVSSAIFALFHPFYGLFMPIVFLFGCVFGWARLRTGGIVVPFILHALLNGLVAGRMLLS